MKYIMAIDAGTTSNRVILYNHDGIPEATARRPLSQHYPTPGWIEHNPVEIWNGVMECLAEVMQGIKGSQIDSIGITNQRETTLLWDAKSGEPIMNAIVWQDRRTIDLCDALTKEGMSDYISSHTGLIIDPYFSATKIAWMLTNVAGAHTRAERGELLFGTVDTWIIWKLTDGRVHCTDYTNASRTMLFDIHSLQWDKNLLSQLNIPPSIMPKVVPSSGLCAESNLKIFGTSIPISGIAGDQQAALFGQCCYQKGSVKNTYGTGCFVLMNIGGQPVPAPQGLLTTIAWGIDNVITYALEGSVYSAGASIQWLRDGIAIIEDAAQSQAVAESVPSSNDLYVVPAFSGLGAPYWDSRARGIIIGITGGTTRAHIVRATLESIGYQSAEVVEYMQSASGIRIASISADGGASANNFILQFQADITGVPVQRPHTIESTSRGAAFLAGLATGYWSSTKELEQCWQLERVFEPAIHPSTRQELLQRWRAAVERSQKWAH